MEENQKIKQLKQMIGRKFHYNDEEITLLTYKYNGIDTDVVIVTDKEWIKTTIFDLGIELSKMKEIILPEVSLSEIFKGNTKYVAIRNNSIDKVQESLLDMLDKVKQSKEHIEQASSIVSIANSIIGTEKLKLEQLVLLNRLNSM